MTRLFRKNCRKSSGATSVRTITGTSLGVPQAEANVVSQNTSRKEISWCNKARLRVNGRAKVWAQLPGAARAWGPRAWAGASRGLGPRPAGAWGPGLKPRPKPLFRRTEKFPGRGLAKRWESAETAAADVGAWREAGTGYPPFPPPPHPATETIQHAHQGRRIKKANRTRYGN